MKTYLELQEFFIEGKAKDRSHVLLHITEPSTPAEFRVGYFFALAEIIDGDISQIEHVQTLIDDLESGVYETDQSPHKSSFETTLEYLNRRGHHILDFDGTCSILTGVIHGNDISFSYHGTPLALLMYQQKQGWGILDILEHETPSETQLFSAVMQGSMNTGDTFFVGTPRVASIFSNDRLLKVITKNDTQTAIKHIEKTIREAEGAHSYGGILFETRPIDEKPHTGPRPKEIDTTSEASMEQLHASEIDTTELLHPSILKRRKKQKKRSPHTETNERQRVAAKEEVPLGNQILVILGKAIVTVGQFLFMIILRILVAIKNLCVGAFILATNVGGKRQLLINNLQRSIDLKKRQYRSLPLISKVLFFATLLFAVIFIGSILFLQYKERQEATLATYVNTVAAVRDKADAAEASLIYDDTNRAFTLLEEATAMIATLPEKTADEQLTKEALAADVEAVFTKLRNIHSVPITVIANLADQGANVTKLARIHNAIIAYGPDDTNHYIVNMDTGAVEARDHASIGVLGQADTPKENDYISFLTQEGRFATLDPDTFVINEGTISADGSKSYTDIAIYNRRAYVVDAPNNTIYRHNPILTGFDDGTVWLKSDTDLTTAIRIAIDGDIYILTQDGTILKFFGGEQVSFDITGLDPALTSPTDLWTYSDVDHLYVLDPINNRVVVLNKNGSLDAQFTATEWNQPEAMIISDETNEVYILDNNVLYRFSTRET